MILDIFLTLIVMYLVTYVTLIKETNEWEWRGFGRFKGQWGKIFFFSSLSSIAVAGAALWKTWDPVTGTGNFWVVLVLGVLAYVLSFAAWTDAHVSLAPSPITSLGNWLLFPIAIIGIITANSADNPMEVFQNSFLPMNLVLGAVINLLVWMLVPVLLFFFAGAGMGWADIKALFMVGFGLAWWVGLDQMFWLMIISCTGQIVVHQLAGVFHWGTLKPQKRSFLNPKGKPRWALPWLPVLSFVFVIGALVLV
jgi:hypothetical protein